MLKVLLSCEYDTKKKKKKKKKKTFSIFLLVHLSIKMKLALKLERSVLNIGSIFHLTDSQVS
jgi:hypothetical protein